MFQGVHDLRKAVHGEGCARFEFRCDCPAPDSMRRMRADDGNAVHGTRPYPAEKRQGRQRHQQPDIALRTLQPRKGRGANAEGTGRRQPKIRVDGRLRSAESARLRADRMADRVELEWDSGEIQALAEKHR